MTVEALSVDQVFATLAGPAGEYSYKRGLSPRRRKDTTKTFFLVVLTVAIAPVSAQKLDLNFDSGQRKACDKAEIDLHGPVLAVIVKSLSK